MAITAMARKSVTDLTRRKARAFFTVVTLAIAVASVGIFAVPSLMQQAMDREIAATHLADLTVTMNPLVMTDAQLRAVGAGAQRRGSATQEHLLDPDLYR